MKGMDTVIHAAAVTDGSGAVAAHPERYGADNIEINANVLGAAHRNSVAHLLFMSCSVLYPSSDRPVRETDSDIPGVHPSHSAGARIKLLAEDLCRCFAALGETRCTVIRHSNIYGPYDKFDLFRGHVFGATIAKAVAAENGITMWGDGKEERDLLHVSDLVRAVGMLMAVPPAQCEIYNVGSGRTLSIRELAQKIVRAAGKDLRVVFDPTRPSIQTRIALDTSKMTAVGWHPQIDLDEGIATTIEWYRKSMEAGGIHRD